MSDAATPLPCRHCGEARNVLGGLVVIVSRRTKRPIYRVHCSCGCDSPERITCEEAIAAHNARVPDPALAAKDDEIRSLEERLRQRIKDHDSAIRGSLLAMDQATKRIAELEAELAALKAQTYHDDEINSYGLGDVVRTIVGLERPTRHHLSPRSALKGLRAEVSRLSAELATAKEQFLEAHKCSLANRDSLWSLAESVRERDAVVADQRQRLARLTAALAEAKGRVAKRFLSESDYEAAKATLYAAFLRIEEQEAHGPVSAVASWADGLIKEQAAELAAAKEKTCETCAYWRGEKHSCCLDGDCFGNEPFWGAEDFCSRWQRAEG
jgi:uncharacterized small protein (DUF1192 family)